MSVFWIGGAMLAGMVLGASIAQNPAPKLDNKKADDTDGEELPQITIDWQGDTEMIDADTMIPIRYSSRKAVPREITISTEALQSMLQSLNNIRQNPDTPGYVDKLSRQMAMLLPPTTSEERVFTCFPTLPTELRLKIWDFALFVPRVVGIESTVSRYRRTFYDFPNGHDEMNLKGVNPETWQPITILNALLQVNLESRTEALKLLKPTLGERIYRYPETYLNPVVDTLLIVNLRDLSEDSAPALANNNGENANSLALKVKSLALWEHEFSETIGWSEDIYRPSIENLAWFSNLEELILLVSSKGSMLGRSSKLSKPSEDHKVVTYEGIHWTTKEVNWEELEVEGARLLKNMASKRTAEREARVKLGLSLEETAEGYCSICDLSFLGRIKLKYRVVEFSDF